MSTILHLTTTIGDIHYNEILVQLPDVFSQPHIFIKIAFHPFTLFLAATTLNLKYEDIKYTATVLPNCFSIKGRLYIPYKI